LLLPWNRDGENFFFFLSVSRFFCIVESKSFGSGFGLLTVLVVVVVVVVIFGFAKELLFEAPFACCSGYGFCLSISYLCAVSVPP
jgi:hypothetical protein